MRKLFIVSIISLFSLQFAACSTSPAVLSVESVDVENQTAVVNQGDLEIQVEFDARYFDDGNGYQEWNDAEINQITELSAYDENDNEVYFSFDQVLEIKELVEDAEAKKLNGVV